MKFFKSMILCGVGLASLALTSCNDWLDINVDPDSPSDAAALYNQRLAHIQFYTRDAQVFAGWRNSFACGDWTSTNGSTYYNVSIHYPTNSLCTTPYQWWFVGAYANVPDMFKKASDAGNYQYAGAAKLLKAYGMMLMTDLYGEMPYTQAAAEPALPEYDNGKTIFMGCIADIDEAIKLLEQGRTQAADLPTLADNDSWNNGDLEKWIKFAYLLKARWLNHLNKKGPGKYTDGKYDAQEILRCLEHAQKQNSDNTIAHCIDANGDYDVLGWAEPIEYNGLFSVCGMNAGYFVTKRLEEHLTNFNGAGIEDPRAAKILPWAVSAKSADTPSDVKFEGKWRRSKGVDMSNVPQAGGPIRASWNAQKWFYIDTQNEDRLNDTLFVEQTSSCKEYFGNVDILYRRGGTDASTESGTFFTRVSSPVYLGVYPEACFIKAEVLFNQNDPKGAFEAYQEGVRASLELMNERLTSWVAEDNNLANCPSFVPFTKEEIDNYVNNGIGTMADLTLGKIFIQKHIALMFSMEVWNDYRRYDYNPAVFPGFFVPEAHKLSADAMKAVPDGKQFRRWRQCSHELNYNSKNLQAIGSQVPGAVLVDSEGKPAAWNQADDVWTIPVWWDSTQE
ncbi:SusD/RagB family nutrient-binding outer membrane lipoprotein [Sodaliphilus sp.]|uniref:SusD/RagB family nutrient-binding outer membrane lipoprotein n=1 Tax=Sodaliphilus sp. TaxID=2815818 RepID=UPI0038901B2E